MKEVHNILKFVLKLVIASLKGIIVLYANELK